MKSFRILAALVTLVFPGGAAHAAVVCVHPDGSVYAGDRPPAGCEVRSKYRGLVKPSGPASRNEAAAYARRAELERAAAASQEIDAVEHRLARLPEVSPASFANDPAGWQAYERSVGARDAAVERLRSRRSELAWALDGLKREFAELTASLADARGGTPPSGWGPLRCARCD